MELPKYMNGFAWFSMISRTCSLVLNHLHTVGNLHVSKHSSTCGVRKTKAPAAECPDPKKAWSGGGVYGGEDRCSGGGESSILQS